jgi:hypothetical protein
VIRSIPVDVLSDEIRERPPAGTPFSNSRFPLPSITGAIHIKILVNKVPTLVLTASRAKAMCGKRSILLS